MIDLKAVHVSIIVPAHNNPGDLDACLSALINESTAESEIIVVDDASTDDTASIAVQRGVRLLQLTKNSGPGAARNYGVRHSTGDILCFVDADVVVAPDVVRRLISVFDKNSEVAAIFGSYDSQPRETGVVSQYKNLLHHFVHQNGNPEASTFWAGCGAIRRSVFEEIGGFDEKRFARASIEDIELGYRLRQSGYRILLDKSLHCTHLKRWDLRTLIKTDITCRAVPWTRLILETKKCPEDLNLKIDQRVCCALVAAACACLAFAFMQPKSLGVSAAALIGVIVLNRKLYAFFSRQHGILFAIACIALHVGYYLYSGLSYLYAWAEFQVRRPPAFRGTPDLERAAHSVKAQNPEND
jgi:GT2 family glycosyltransferase